MSFNRTEMPVKMKRRRQSWEVFDSLPREVRDALNYASFKYACTGCLEGKGPALVKRLIEIDAKQVAASYQQREETTEAETLLRSLGL